MRNREQLVEFLQTSKGMDRKDAEAFVIVNDECKRKEQAQSRIAENMTGAARGAF
jgi:hypothetical protein